METLDSNRYKDEEEENKLRDECEALIALLNSEEYKEIPRSEMDKYYDEISVQLDKMPRNFALWYLLQGSIREWEREIIPLDKCNTKDEVAWSYMLAERVKVLKEFREELACGLF